MKKLIFAFALLTITAVANLFSYEDEITKIYRIILTDALGNKDTASVTYIVDENMDGCPSSAIDSCYGEVNLYGTPYKDLEVRSIKRNKPGLTTNNSGKITDIWKLSDIDYHLFYYDLNSDLKEEYTIHELGSIYNSYENAVFKINAKNFPVQVRAETYAFKGTMAKICKFKEGDSTLNFIAYYDFSWRRQDSLNISDTLFEINSPTELDYIAFVKFLNADGIDENYYSSSHQDTSQNLLFPNPATNVLSVKTRSLKEIRIVNSIGETIEAIKPSSDEISIDVSKYPKGCYYIDDGKKVNKFILK